MIVSIWGENMLGNLSLDIICSLKLTVFIELRSRKTVRFSSTDKFSILVKLEFGDNGFHGGRKTREPGEKPSEQGKKQQQTQATGTEFKLGQNGVRQVNSPLCHHCYPKKQVPTAVNVI